MITQIKNLKRKGKNLNNNKVKVTKLKLDHMQQYFQQMERMYQRLFQKKAMFSVLDPIAMMNQDDFTKN